MNLLRLLKERKINLIYEKELNKLVEELKDKEIITGKSFTRDLLLEKLENLYSVSQASIREVEKIKKLIKEKEIVGFGGGKPIDVAKKVSCDLNLDLTIVPTAPTHDGIASKNCSLYNKNKRRTILAKYPNKIIIPLSLWENSKDLKNAGVCDIISNLIALQDISLAEKKGIKFLEFYKKLSFESVKKILSFKNNKELAESLILSGIAMEKGSVYCSGSEHEITRLLENKLNYLHGQLAGTGTLIAAKVYEHYSTQLEGLKFNSKELFYKIREKMEKVRVYEFALQPLFDKNFKPKILREISKIRPERYNLWNVINSKEIDWDYIIDKILKN
ncbi:MAG TPA: iron-containing alcohol dehydrogenase [Candidatus Aenigmarchaeota archaeon]|nr:iron-containing alcohol dehydrogenase [Candidatus Aenigmarchaeota archaeon]